MSISLSQTVLVTGGAGFIGANFIHHWLSDPNRKAINLDKLTYAGNLDNLAGLDASDRLEFVRADIGDGSAVQSLLERHRPRAILNFAAESHVDRSISGPEEFIQTNIVGTFRLLQTALRFFRDLAEDEKKQFRFLHVSTDEVYGSLHSGDRPFTEKHPFEPNSPYSASKASSDHLVRAFCQTYGLPVLTTNCSNNYGPYQFPEKLIPLVIHNAINEKALPIYGDGQNVRDWLFVADHCEAIATVLEKGVVGETYNVGGWNEMANIDVVHTICDLLDQERPRADGRSYREQITFVKDRPGHDRRYAIDATKIARELGWKPKETFQTGIAKTVRWYLSNEDWVSRVTSGAYREWSEKQYGSQT